MAELSNLRKSRSANRNVVKGFVVKAKDAIAAEYSDSVRLTVTAILKAIDTKKKVIAETDAAILALLTEDLLEADIEEVTSN